MLQVKLTFFFLLLTGISVTISAQTRPRELGIKIGVLPTGSLNAITDVAGVKVGQIIWIADKRFSDHGISGHHCSLTNSLVHNE